MMMTTMTNHKRQGRAPLALILAAGGLLLLAACSRQDDDLDGHLGHLDGTVTQAPQPGAAALPISPEQAATDAAISAEIKAKFAADSTLAPLAIGVRTREGLVELSGQAPDVAVRDHATRVAATAKNVLSVDNHMAVPRS